jgi:endonuclease YncB( thermonuclease family)
VVVALFTEMAWAQTVVDGDTIKLDGTTYADLGHRRAGEEAGLCRWLDGWREGDRRHARACEGRTITCEAKATHRYGRTVALCRADGLELGAELVSAGMAWAFTRYSSDYISQERAAIGGRLGVHSHDCEKAWDWRARNRGDG